MNVLSRNNVSVIEGNKQTLLFAHGFGCNKDMWNGITPAFEGAQKQVLFDYVGSGQSDVSAFDIEKYSSIEGYAQDIIDVCEALNLNSGVVFIGHSVSCSAGIVASIKKPELFDSLILIGPTPCFLNEPPEYLGGFNTSDLEGLLSLMDQNYIGWANYLAPIIAGETGGKVSGELSTSFCSTDPVTAKVFARTTFFADNREDFKQSVCPCLVIHHKEDALVPNTVGEYIKNNLANHKFVELPVKGHCAHMSHPDLVIEAIQNYLDD